MDVFLLVLETRKSKIKVAADLMSDGDLFLIDSVFLLCPHVAEGLKGPNRLPPTPHPFLKYGGSNTPPLVRPGKRSAIELLPSSVFMFYLETGSC